MSPDTHRERILEALRQSTRPLDDDQLAGRANIHPRQSVNQICRALEGARILRRYVGPEGKIVNELVPQPAVAKRLMLDQLGLELGLVLLPEKIGMPSGDQVEVDGVDTDREVLVECWTHRGTPEPEQLHQALSAAFKLSWVGGRLDPRPQLILCSCDKTAAAHFVPGSATWAARALADVGITVSVVSLPTR